MHPELKQKPGVLWYMEYFSSQILRKTPFKFWETRLSAAEQQRLSSCPFQCCLWLMGILSPAQTPHWSWPTQQQRKLSLGLVTEQSSRTVYLELFKHPPQYSKASVHSPIKSPYSFLIYSHSLSTLGNETWQHRWFFFLLPSAAANTCCKLRSYEWWSVCKFNLMTAA